MGMTAHNLRRRKLAEAEAKRQAASLKAAPAPNIAAELEVERARNALLSAELEAEKTAKAALEEELTVPSPMPRDGQRQQQQRPHGRGGRG